MSVRVERIGRATLFLGDAAEVLPTLPCMDAVVTDPPYGIGENHKRNASRGNSTAKWKRGAVRDYGAFDWDAKPVSPELMAMVRAAGRWQVIFGGNFYPCPPATCWLVWDKETSGDFADCELAWTNLPKAVRRIRYLWNGFARANGEARGDHPTQKPVGVMRWALQQLPPGVQTVIDPMMGSGTTGVAAVLEGLAFTGIERHPPYFDAACRRLREALTAGPLFTPAQSQAELLEGERRT